LPEEIGAKWPVDATELVNNKKEITEIRWRGEYRAPLLSACIMIDVIVVRELAHMEQVIPERTEFLMAIIRLLLFHKLRPLIHCLLRNFLSHLEPLFMLPTMLGSFTSIANHVSLTIL
jgi:hypothetical protein